MASLKRVLQSANQRLTPNRGRVKVLVALNDRSPSDATLDRLRGLGLRIDRVIGDTVVGTIKADRLSALESDDGVVEAELSTPLEPYT